MAGAGAAWIAGLGRARAERLADSETLFAAAYRDPAGRYGLAMTDESGRILSRQSLPVRGHGLAASPASRWLIVFARRPGNVAIALDRSGETAPLPFHTPADRHFYGHGALSADGQLLLAAENAFESGVGVIGLYDTTDRFCRIGEFASHGTGPHEILLMPDGETVCVANGGIATHPRLGRQKLNLPTMASSVDFIDMRTGALRSSHRLPETLQRLSLRHMAVDATGCVWIGGQYQEASLQVVPVLARLDPDQGLESVALPEPAALAFGSYVGSVATSRDGSLVAVSSPRSGLLYTLDARTGKLLTSSEIAGVCGVAAAARGFLTSNERGDFGQHRHDLAWDNHVLAL